MRRHPHLRWLAVVLVLAMVGPVFSAAHSVAAPDTDLSALIDEFRAMVVDDARERIYLSSGVGGEGVVVTDFDGAVVGTIGDLPDASGMVLTGDTLYVGLRAAGEIAAVDLSTTSPTVTRTPLTGVAQPMHLAFAGSRVWLAHGCDTASSGMASFDPSTEITTVHDGEGFPAACPRFATSPAAPGTLVAAHEGFVGVYDVLSGEPAVLRTGDAYGTADLSLTADGGSILFPSRSPYSRINERRVADLAATGTVHHQEGSPTAVAAGSDGTRDLVAGGTDEYWGPQIVVTDDSGTRLARFGGSGEKVLSGGMAFSDDAGRLFVALAVEGAVHLEVITEPWRDTMFVSLRSRTPEQIPPGGEVTFEGYLQNHDSTIPGEPLALFRSMDGGDPMEVDSLVADETGRFRFSDLPPQGDALYAIRYEGDAARRPASRTEQLTVAPLVAPLKLSAPTTVGFGRTGLFKVQITPQSVSGMPIPFENGSVVIEARPPGRSWRAVGLVHVNGQGYGETPIALRWNAEVRAVWAGDDSYAPVESAVEEVRVPARVATRIRKRRGNIILLVAVAPRHPGQKVLIGLRTDLGPYWATVIKRKFRLNRRSVVAVRIDGRRGRYEAFVKFRGDRDHSSNSVRRRFRI